MSTPNRMVQGDGPAHQDSGQFENGTHVEVGGGGDQGLGRGVTRSRSEMVLTIPKSKCMLPGGKSVDNLQSNSASRAIRMEEVAPLRSCLLKEKDDSQAWQLSLTRFTSKRRGISSADKNMPKNIRRYYKRQNELIDVYEGLQMEDVGGTMAAAHSAQNTDLRRRAGRLSKISFFINLLLLVGKTVAAGLSGSLSIITSVIDSVVDLASGSLMWWSNRAMKRRDPYLYPQGRTKLEPIAIVVLSVIMSLASIAMIRQAIEKIIAFALFDVRPADLHNETVVYCLTIPEMTDYVHIDGSKGPVFETASIVICVSTIFIKLVLYLVCRRVQISSVQALAQDHRNDVVSNTVALACGLIGYLLWKYADPIGAILMSIYIIISWFKTGSEQIRMLTGHSARPDFLKRLTWIALNHHATVRLIDTVRAFHFGNNFLVEVDIVLPAEMSLREAHDVGESLQCKLEQLDEVERAFVHLDYEVTHHPDSEHKVV